MEAAGSPAAERARAPTRIVFGGRAGELAPIVLVNIALTIVTLGVYRFWAVTRVRRYLWSGASLLDDPFEYTGTASELFRGFLFALFAVLLPLTLLGKGIDIVTSISPYVGLPMLVPFYAVIFLFLPAFAAFRARRYRLRRTLWRGVRGGQEGASGAYALASMGWRLLVLLTLGWAYPWMRMRLAARTIGGTSLGDRTIRFSGSTKPLLRRFALFWCASAVVAGFLAGCLYAAAVNEPYVFRLAWRRLWIGPSGPEDGVARALALFLGPPLLLFLAVSLLAVRYRAHEAAYMAFCARWGDVSFRFDATARQFLTLTVGNLLIFAATLGLGGAFIQRRNARFFCRHLELSDGSAIAGLMRSPDAQAGSEGLALVFDADAA